MAKGEDSSRSAKWRVNYAVRHSALLPAPSRLIMLVLSDIADAGTAETPPKWTPSLTQLASESGLSLATVKRHLASLEAEGWLIRIRPTEQERVQGGRTRYRLCVPAADPSAHGEPTDPVEVGADRADLYGGSAHSDTETGSHRADPSAHGEPTSSNNQNNNHNYSSSTAAAVDGHSDTKPKTKRKRRTVDEDDPDFVKFWAAYPRRVGKPAAREKYAAAIAAGAHPADILDGAILYNLKRKGQDPQFTAHPATWLHQERWKDEDDRPSVPAGPVARCRLHQLEVPCRSCAADSKARRDEDWPPPDDVEWPPEVREPDDAPYDEPPY